MRADVHIAIAETEDEKRAVYRFRYTIYVEEMGKYRSVADHAQRMFYEPVDAQSRIIYATENGEVVATARATWGGDGPIPQRMIVAAHLLLNISKMLCLRLLKDH